jgi:hypothetical protein
VIPVDSGGGAGVGAFPDPPKGDPGQIANAGTRLSDLGGDLDDVEGGLRGASNEVALDWQGYAAGIYHGCSEQLSGIARGAAETFRDCAHAVSSYGRDLDDVQQKVKGLRTQYDDAVRRQQAAATQATGLSQQAGSATKPADATRLRQQAGDAARTAGDAVREANQYVTLATQAISDFKGKARGYASTLEGYEPGTPHGALAPPFIASGMPGPTFGFPGTRNPLTGASPSPTDLTGVARVGDPWNSPIPGYGTHMDATHGNLQSPDDLTNLILLLAAPVAGKAVEGLGGSALDWLTDKGVSKAGQVAIDKIEQKVLEGGQNAGSKLSRGVKSILDRGADDPVDPPAAKTPAQLEAEEEELQKSIQGAAVDIADKAGALPDGVGDILHNLLDYGGVYRSFAVSKLIDIRNTLAGMSGSGARAGVKALNSILDKIS